MRISEARLRVAARNVMLEMLQSATPVSEAGVAGAMRAAMQKPETPTTQAEDVAFSFKERASASKFNGITDSVAKDLDIVYTALSGTEEAISALLTKTLERIQIIESKARRAKDRINGLLLVHGDSGGYLATFTEDFSDHQDIDRTNTTTILDKNAQSAYLQSAPNYDIAANEVDLSAVQPSDIKISILTPDVSPFPGLRIGRATDMLTSSEYPWVYSVRSTTQREVGLEVTIDLINSAGRSESSVDISRILMEMHSVGDPTRLLLRVSEDGVEWFPLGDDVSTRVISGPSLFMANGTQKARFIRLTMSRDVHSRREGRTGFVYDFGIKRLTIADREFRFVSQGDFASNNLVLNGKDQAPVKIRRAVLAEACNSIPEDTSLVYYIDFLNSEGAILSSQEVVPLDSERDGQRVAELRDDIEYETQATVLADEASSTDQRQGQGKFRPLSVRISNEGQPRVWRGVGDRNHYRSIIQTDGRAVEEGWITDGNYYYTFFDLSEPLSMDLGHTEAWMDGIKRTGPVELTRGLHHIRTSKNNWISLEGMGGVTAFDGGRQEFTGQISQFGSNGLGDDITVISGSVRDPLYPYNHKLLVEGISASEDVSGDQIVYTGANKYGILMRRRTQNAIESISGTFEAMRSYLESEVEGEDGKNINVLVHDSEGIAIDRECFVIEQKVGVAEALRLRAEFKTIDPTRTPILSGYKIKVSD